MGLGLLLVIGALDYAVGLDVNLTAFYLLPVSLS
jgi:hypothetical protein